MFKRIDMYVFCGIALIVVGVLIMLGFHITEEKEERWGKKKIRTFYIIYGSMLILIGLNLILKRFFSPYSLNFWFW